jgi:hypothetical protein
MTDAVEEVQKRLPALTSTRLLSERPGFNGVRNTLNTQVYSFNFC